LQPIALARISIFHPFSNYNIRVALSLSTASVGPEASRRKMTCVPRTSQSQHTAGTRPASGVRTVVHCIRFTRAWTKRPQPFSPSCRPRARSWFCLPGLYGVVFCGVGRPSLGHPEKCPEGIRKSSTAGFSSLTVTHAWHFLRRGQRLGTAQMAAGSQSHM
jgi:hypothetical protein